MILLLLEIISSQVSGSHHVYIIWKSAYYRTVEPSVQLRCSTFEMLTDGRPAAVTFQSPPPIAQTFTLLGNAAQSRDMEHCMDMKMYELRQHKTDLIQTYTLFSISRMLFMISMRDKNKKYT